MSPAHFRAALAALLESLEYATELSRDPWHFAVEIEVLRSLGLSNSDLRWLLCREWVRHATETTRRDADVRSFVPIGSLVLDDRCCFVLTPVGQAAMNGEGAGPALPVVSVANCLNGVHRVEDQDVPQWDKDRRLLRYGGEVVKQYKVPAPNQEVVLVAFQEENWSVRIDDPLPMSAAIDPKQRLHDTINSLNRNQRAALLRFFGDGSGQAICWEPAETTARTNGVATGLSAGA